MRLGDLKGALLDADFAIRDGENNAKALFRQGQVSFPALPLLISSLSYQQSDLIMNIFLPNKIQLNKFLVTEILFNYIHEVLFLTNSFHSFYA